MRTNISINPDLMEQAIALSGLKTKRAIVEEALTLYVRLLHQQALLDLRGKLNWEGNLEELRTNR